MVNINHQIFLKFDVVCYKLLFNEEKVQKVYLLSLGIYFPIFLYYGALLSKEINELSSLKNGHDHRAHLKLVLARISLHTFSLYSSFAVPLFSSSSSK